MEKKDLTPEEISNCLIESLNRHAKNHGQKPLSKQEEEEVRAYVLKRRGEQQIQETSE